MCELADNFTLIEAVMSDIQSIAYGDRDPDLEAKYPAAGPGGIRVMPDPKPNPGTAATEQDELPEQRSRRPQHRYKDQDGQEQQFGVS